MRSCSCAIRGLLFLLLIPELAREHAAAEGAVIDAHKLVPVIPEDQEVLRVDFGDDGAVAELIGLRIARQVAVYQAIELRTTSHPVLRYWIVLAPSTPMSSGITLRLMCRSRLIT